MMRKRAAWKLRSHTEKGKKGKIYKQNNKNVNVQLHYKCHQSHVEIYEPIFSEYSGRLSNTTLKKKNMFAE